MKTGSFKKRVLNIVSKIPKGKTLSYKQVAELAGSLRAYRAVGSILNRNHNKNIPCHRVIKNNGEYGGYNKGEQEKKRILNKEFRHKD